MQLKLSCLNAPIVVTVIGGALLGILGSKLQNEASTLERERVRTQQIYDRKQELMVEFSDAFPSTLDVAYRFKLRYIWLLERDRNKPYPDGRTFEETRRYYEEARNKYFSSRTADSLCAQIRATFDMYSVQALAADLDGTMDDLLLTKEEPIVLDAFNKANDQYQALIELMGDELKEGMTSE